MASFSAAERTGINLNRSGRGISIYAAHLDFSASRGISIYATNLDFSASRGISIYAINLDFSASIFSRYITASFFNFFRQLLSRSQSGKLMLGNLGPYTMQNDLVSLFQNHGCCRTGLKAWQARQGSRHIETRILQLMPEEIQRTIIQTNGTSCFRDLITQELDYVEAANRGAAENLAKAGTRLLDDETRRERAERKSQRTMGRKGPGVKLHDVIPEALEERPPLVPRSEGRKRSASSMDDASTGRQKHISPTFMVSNLTPATPFGHHRLLAR
ncbi:MAG: hypothetical protein LQ344_007988 [Seirophora lacunosa]|nr:MAG: hypothetical protein LQ344_007988 [Seirophora lacunosa]